MIQALKERFQANGNRARPETGAFAISDPNMRENVENIIK